MKDKGRKCSFRNVIERGHDTNAALTLDGLRATRERERERVASRSQQFVFGGMRRKRGKFYEIFRCKAKPIDVKPGNILRVGLEIEMEIPKEKNSINFSQILGIIFRSF